MAPTVSDQYLIDQAYSFAQDNMRNYDASHDFSHIQRVLCLAKFIAKSEQQLHQSPQYDKTTVTLAAILHDIGDRKYAAPGDSSNPIQQFLLSIGAKQELAQKVQSIAANVSFNKEARDPASMQLAMNEHPELRVIQDADRLDALGAIGIARCFTFGAANAERERSKASSIDTGNDGSATFCMRDAIDHFQDKLVKLEELMKTNTGRRLARKRTERLVEFQTWWQEEQGDLC